MWHTSGYGKGKIGVILQLAAIVMLLFMPQLPLLARVLTVHEPGHCAMDHRICGCSRERIASHTCCCYRNMKPASVSAGPGICHLPTKAHEHHGLDHNVPPASYSLSSLPCGLDHQMISSVNSEMKYLHFVRAPLPAHMPAPHNPQPGGDDYLSPSLEPLTPPPKISLFV